MKTRHLPHSHDLAERELYGLRHAKFVFNYSVHIQNLDEAIQNK